MGNCRFADSFYVASQAMARLRSIDETPDYAAIYREAQAELDVLLGTPAPPAPVVRWKQPEEPVLPPKPRVTEHREKTFVFSDGSECSCCTATGCSWGIRPDGKVRGRKHSGDGVPVASELDAAQEIPDLLVDDEPAAPEVAELNVEAQVPVAGQDDDQEMPAQAEGDEYAEIEIENDATEE